MKLTILISELQTIINHYLTAKHGLTGTGLMLKETISPLEPEKRGTPYLEIEVQEAVAKPQAISTPDDPWVNIAHRKPPENAVVVWGKRDACPTYQLGNGNFLIEGFDYWMLVPILS